MAAERRQLSEITIGGKGSSLSSSSVFAVANGLAQLHIDSSALDRLSNPTPPPSLLNFQFPLPNYLSSQEDRASLLLLLNKLLLSASSGSNIRHALPLLIRDHLNHTPLGEALKESIHGVTEMELFVLGKSSPVLEGICAILDHQASALSAIADAVAALSCEATHADVSALNLMDSGDGFSAKDEIGVASDVKVLLNGSKLVGKVECDAVAEIPKVHGSLREVSRLLHTRTRVELNSGIVKGGKGGSRAGGTGKALATALLPLAAALRYVGENSLCRAELDLDAVGNDNVRSCLKEMLGKECPMLNSLRDLFKSISLAAFEENY